MGRTAQLQGPPDPYPRARMAGCRLVSPRSGEARRTGEGLRSAARRVGLDVHVLGDDDDPAELARSTDAEALGVAGGDGSLAAVAAVAIERDLPFVCIPFGTRNHFARDLGIDRNDPIAALAAFSGVERRIDVGCAGDRVFLNNVSPVLYAQLVHRREHHRRRREALARVRAWRMVLTHRDSLGITLDGAPVDARLVLLANNAYVLELPSIGSRNR